MVLVQLLLDRQHIAAQLPGILASKDAQEGLQSFLERREARFEGR